MLACPSKKRSLVSVAERGARQSESVVRQEALGHQEWLEADPCRTGLGDLGRGCHSWACRMLKAQTRSGGFGYVGLVPLAVATGSGRVLTFVTVLVEAVPGRREGAAAELYRGSGDGGPALQSRV